MSFPVKTLSRRQFLIGLKAALIPMPFLPSLVKGAHAQTDSDRLNFVSVRSIYGQLPQIFYPDERPTQRIDEHAYYRAFSQGETISDIINSSFKPVAHKLSLLQGVDCSWGGHNHSTMLAPSRYNGDFGDPEQGTSLDEIIARSSLYPVTPAQRILHLEPHREGWGYSWYNGTRQPYDANMDSLKSKLFGSGFNTGDGSGGVDANTLQALKAVDIAKPAYDSLRRSNKMSQVDRDRLGDYLDMLSDLEGKLASQRNLSTCSPPNIDTSTKVGEHDASTDLLIAALVCGMTKVASISMATWGALAGENGADFHSPSHWTYENAHAKSNPFGNDYLIDARGSSREAKYLRMYSYVANRVGEMMSKMDSVIEANGNTLLDNSIVYWGNEQSGSSAHGYQSMPIVVGGTAHGQFTPGYWDFTHKPHLFYAGRKDIHPAVGTVPYTNFLVTLGHALGLQQSEWEAHNNSGAGFGEFRIHRYSYNDGPNSREGAQIYAPFFDSDAGKRKTVPHWFNKA